MKLGTNRKQQRRVGVDISKEHQGKKVAWESTKRAKVEERA